MKTLLKLVRSKELDSFDSALKEVLTLSIDWLQLVSHLISAYDNRARQFHYDQTLHLLIICPNDVDALLHISVSDKGTDVTMSMLRRDTDTLSSSSDKQQLAEAQQVSSLVNKITHWLWRSLITKDKKQR